MDPTPKLRESCYLCGTKSSKIVFVENSIPIVECLACGHVYSTFLQDEHYDGYWPEGAEHYDLHWWDIAHRDIYKDFCNTFLKSPKGRILDVGCGLGFFIRTINEIKPGWKTVGYEISEDAVRFAREKNLLSDVHSGIVQNSDLPSESFDVITLWDVIEHIPNPHSLLQYLHTLLKPGGILFVETPNFPMQLLKAKLKKAFLGGDPNAHYLEAKDHINHYKKKTLSFLAGQCGFSDVTFTILKPISSVSGSRSLARVFAKKCLYYFAGFVRFISRENLNVALTLFAVLHKNPPVAASNQDKDR
ncbi:methyltransferase domain-containing protein [Leptospira fluminis]|uniref:Methyltransferase domain-containing protein n=1 Tax=Leptospira fluminis TaxID=2484979 RepID=A0A4R9GR89_9LEPT|nr:methyltransferase domain-containing protein [Leptospira fluminis]TGK20682.1 methyltransferase domain-containing protein [Leptospira fluminis]